MLRKQVSNNLFDAFETDETMLNTKHSSSYVFRSLRMDNLCAFVCVGFEGNRAIWRLLVKCRVSGLLIIPIFLILVFSVL